MKKSPWRELILVAVVLTACGILYLLPAPPGVLGEQGVSVPARVISTDDTDVVTHGVVPVGSQQLVVEIAGGDFTGQRFRAGNVLRGQLELDKLFVPGDRVEVSLPPDARPEESVIIAREYSRNGWMALFFGIFALLLCIFGSWTGVKALISFVFSCLAIWKLVIPLVLRGWSADWVIFGTVSLLAAVIVVLVAGFSRKAAAALAGSASGLLAGLGMAHLSASLMKINGAAMPYVQTLLYSGDTGLSISDIFIGSTILASSGAVMDLAMDISAGVEEVARHNQSLSMRELTASGIRIGRSVVGTMTTTLLLAYSGGYLTLLMMFSLQGTAVWDFLNNPLVATEVVRTLVGSFAIILVAPFTAIAAGWLFSNKRK